MFKRSDYLIISVICLFLGIFLVTQFYAAKNVKKVTQPENNAVLAVEVSKLTKANAGLRSEVQKLTKDLSSYKNTSESSKKAYEQFTNDTERLDVINGSKPKLSQGITISIQGNLITPQIVDLVNAIKNIGAEIIDINGKRIVLNTNLSEFSGLEKYEIKVSGNSNLLKSAMERKGGIVEQISTKDIQFNIAENESLEIGNADPIKFKYAKIIDEK